MIVRVPALLDGPRLAAVHECLRDASWDDGRATAGFQSAEVKRNQQLPQGSASAREAGKLVLQALESSAAFLSATLPHHVYPPLFNRYEVGMSFGAHIDNAVRQIPGTAHRLRTDVSATLFLSAPSEYDGGELIVEDTFGEHAVKLAAGDLVIYAASSRHSVVPITRGTRLAAFFWVQSMVRDEGERQLLHELDTAIRTLAQARTEHTSVLQLTACYHNLLRRWSQL